MTSNSESLSKRKYTDERISWHAACTGAHFNGKLPVGAEPAPSPLPQTSQNPHHAHTQEPRSEPSPVAVRGITPGLSSPHFLQPFTLTGPRASRPGKGLLCGTDDRRIKAMRCGFQKPRPGRMEKRCRVRPHCGGLFLPRAKLERAGGPDATSSPP